MAEQVLTSSDAVESPDDNWLRHLISLWPLFLFALVAALAVISIPVPSGDKNTPVKVFKPTLSDAEPKDNERVTRVSRLPLNPWLKQLSESRQEARAAQQDVEVASKKANDWAANSLGNQERADAAYDLVKATFDRKSSRESQLLKRNNELRREKAEIQASIVALRGEIAYLREARSKLLSDSNRLLVDARRERDRLRKELIAARSDDHSVQARRLHGEVWRSVITAQ